MAALVMLLASPLGFGLGGGLLFNNRSRQSTSGSYGFFATAAAAIYMSGYVSGCVHSRAHLEEELEGLQNGAKD